MKRIFKYLPQILFHSLWYKKYNIKRGYIHRKSVPHFDDTLNEEEWQREVYVYAKDIFKRNSYSTLLDIGCGSGFKLIKHFSGENFIGVELEPTLQFLKKKYPNHKWFHFDEIPDSSYFDLVILSDVIEHIDKPDYFFSFINDKIEFDKIIISTPERDLTRGRFDYGPSQNIFHYREWNFEEFKNFVSNFFDVENHFITNGSQKTQVVLASKKKNF